MDSIREVHRITAADLILNPDGSVYHLALKPGDVAEKIILVGDPERIDILSPVFDDIEIERSKREFRTVTGWVGNQRISIVSTGIGTDNIDIVINELDTLFNINLETRQPLSSTTRLSFLRLGTSGALQAETPLHHILHTQTAIGFDMLGQYYQQHRSEYEKALKQALEQHLANALGEPAPRFYVVDNQSPASLFDNSSSGITCTMPGFYAAQGRTLRYQARYPDLLEVLTAFDFEGRRVMNFEMETAGTLLLCQLLGHRYHSYSIILANRNLGEFRPVNDHQVLATLKQLLPI